MNKVIISGNVTKDGELAFTQNSGKAILKFCVAVARGFKKEDGVDWVNCVLFEKRAENLSPYLVKGQRVLLDGSLRINSYEKDGTRKTFTEVIVSNLELIGSKKGTKSEPSGEYEDMTPLPDDSEVPF
jgi:single-strand DNA-binding protein